MEDTPRCTRRCHKSTDGRLIHARCYDLTGADILNMNELYVILHTRLLPGTAHGDRISGSRERPLGVNVEVLSFIGGMNNPDLPEQFDTAHQVGRPPMLDTLNAWAAHTSAKLGWPVRLHTIASASNFLYAQHDWISYQDWAVDYGEDIRDTAHHARLLCQLYPARPEIKVGVPCRNETCRALGLFVSPGSDRVECQVCPQRMTFTEYHDWVKKWAEYAKGKTA
jgi:hypothetical protein